MTDEQRRAHAQRILNDHITDIDFLDVAEDEDLYDADPTDEDLREIHRLIYTAEGVLQ